MFLTPKSRARKTTGMKKLSAKMKKELRKLKKYDVQVSEATNEELMEVVSRMEGTSMDVLEEIFAESETSGILPHSWFSRVNFYILC